MQQFILPAKRPDLRQQALGQVLRFMEMLPEGRAWRVEIRQDIASRTDQQNRGLFGVAYPPLVEATGYTKDELHWTFCCKFFGTTSRELFGETVTRPIRTTTTDESGKRNVIDWAQFSEFYAMVQREGAEIGVYVPDPDPNWRTA